MAQTSELSQMHVPDPRGPQLFRQDLAVELRIVSRSWDTAHVYDALDAVRPQKREEVLPCAGRMPNRQHSLHSGLDLSRGKGSPTHWVRQCLLEVVTHEQTGCAHFSAFAVAFLFS